MRTHILSVIEALFIARNMFHLYRQHQRGGSGISYVSMPDRYGVPQFTLVLGTGREAWRVSDFAANYFSTRAPHVKVLEPK